MPPIVFYAALYRREISKRTVSELYNNNTFINVDADVTTPNFVRIKSGDVIAEFWSTHTSPWFRQNVGNLLIDFTLGFVFCSFLNNAIVEMSLLFNSDTRSITIASSFLFRVKFDYVLECVHRAWWHTVFPGNATLVHVFIICLLLFDCTLILGTLTRQTSGAVS